MRPGTAQTGGGPVDAHRPEPQRSRPPRLLRARYFVWIIVPVGLIGAWAAFGLPHAIWSYDFRGTIADRAGRWYTRCTFIGPYGAFTTYPTDGRCGWFVFRKPEDAQ